MPQSVPFLKESSRSVTHGIAKLKKNAVCTKNINNSNPFRKNVNGTKYME